MRLLVFPSYPLETNGYGIAVKADISRLKISDKDRVVWYVNYKKEISNNQYIIERFSKYSIKRIYNFIRGNHNTEVYVSDFKAINLDSIDEIFCGEVVFYRTLRKLFPHKRIIVRFHNCYARIKNRVDLLENSHKLSLLYRTNLKSFYRLEKEIMADNNVYKIFISNEDRDYYTSNFGKYNDSEVWGFTPNIEIMNHNRHTLSLIRKIVWFGGLDSHKIDSIKWFIESVYEKLHLKYKNIEFHLYGNKTQIFNNPTKSIFGHGFYNGKGMPFKEEALFINPDLTGGGVKIKLMNYFEQGVRFLTTPFGYEGYPHDLIDEKYCFVKTSDEWFDFLDSILDDNISNYNENFTHREDKFV